MLGRLAWTGSGDLGAKLAMLLVTLLAAQHLAPSEFGRYVALYAVAIFAASMWDLGISSLLVREIAAERVSVLSGLRQAARLRVRTAALWIVTLTTGLLLVGKGAMPDAGTSLGYGAASLAFGLNIALLASLRGAFRFRTASLALSTGRWLATGCAIVLWSLPVGLTGINVLALAFLAGELGTLAIAGTAALLHADTNHGSGLLTVRESLPFAVNGILSTAYNRLDVIVVAALAAGQAAGEYATASRLQDALYLLPTTVGAVALPTIARTWGVDAKQDAGRVALGLAIAGATAGILVAAVLTMALPHVIELILGNRYEDSLGPTRILIWFLPFAMIQSPILAALGATGHAGAASKVFAVTLLVSMTLHLSLDWWAGAEGAAFASLARDLVATPLAVVVAVHCKVFSGLRKPNLVREFELAILPASEAK